MNETLLHVKNIPIKQAQIYGALVAQFHLYELI